MKQLLWGLCALLILGVEPTWGQSATKYQQSVSIYTNSKSSRPYYNGVKYRWYDLAKPSFGYRLTNEKGHFHEFGISDLKFLREFSNYYDSMTYGRAGLYFQTTSRFTLSYQKNYLLFKGMKTRRLKAYFGVGLDYRFWRRAYFPAENGPSFTFRQNGVTMSMTPRINYSINQRLSLDVSSTMAIGTGAELMGSSGNQDPTSDYHYDRFVFLGNLSGLRLGVNLKLF